MPLVAFLSGVFWLSTSLVRAVPDSDSKYGKTCIDAGCHAVDVAGAIPKHIPYLEGECLHCHTDHAGTEPQLLRSQGDDLCLKCHEDVETKAPEGHVLHPPKEVTCSTCHTPHESRVRNLLREESLLGECASCHADFLKASRDLPYQHQFFEPATQCGSCHYAHRREGGKYLRKNLTEGCLTCHDLAIHLENRVLENVAQEIREAPVVHPPLKNSSCSVCHTPHGANQSSLLRAGYPSGKYERYDSQNYQLCWSCHDAALVENGDGVGITEFRDGRRNLHRAHVVDLPQGRACHNCHTPHVSERPHLLKEKVRFKEWEAPLEMAVTPDGGSCVTPCHAKREYRRSTPAE